MKIKVNDTGESLDGHLPRDKFLELVSKVYAKYIINDIEENDLLATHDQSTHNTAENIHLLPEID